MTIAPQVTSLLRDTHGRVARDLRVSLTDRCNLRCTYCMPAAGLAWLPGPEILTDAEVLTLVRVAVERLGVRKVRLTGGEPLLRPGLATLVAGIRQFRTELAEPPEVSLTTNGVTLERQLPALVEAGLQRVNISLDSLDRARYAGLARRDRLPQVLAGIAAAAAAGLRPLKVNTVVMRGVNESDVLGLAGFCLGNGYRLRFIEQMPLGPRHGWDRAAMVTAEEILALLRQRYSLEPAPARGAAPSEDWLVSGPDGTRLGTIGVIASVTRPFCGACDRSRLTADGQVRSCLFSHAETDLRTPLRAGVTDSELAALWVGAHQDKPAGHGMDRADFRQPRRTMSSIGG